MRNKSTRKNVVPVMTTDKAHEPLGVQIAFDENQTSQIETLQQKCKTYASMFAQ